MGKCEFFTLATTVVYEVFVIILLFPVILVEEIVYQFKHRKYLNSAKLHNLKKKIVLITGASSGIGEGIARHFYLAGCKVILAARRKTELERVQNSLTDVKTKIGNQFAPEILVLDLIDSQSINEFAEKAIAIHGRIDILVNNAGVFHQGQVLDTVMEVDKYLMSVNYMGPLSLTKIIGNHMLQKGNGHIAFVSSYLGKAALINSSSYCASKSALQTMVDVLYAEVAPKGVDVTIISPSMVNTQLLAKGLNEKGEEIGKDSKDFQNGYSVNDVSKRIFKAIVNREMDVTMAPFQYRLGIHLRTFAPVIFFYLIRRFGEIKI